MAFDEITAQAMRDVARLEQRVAELEAALRRLQCEIGVSVEAHDVIVKAIGTPQRPIAGVPAARDAERLEWLMRQISGAELRRLGIVTSAGMTRELLDRRMTADGVTASQEGQLP